MGNYCFVSGPVIRLHEQSDERWAFPSGLCCVCARKRMSAGESVSAYCSKVWLRGLHMCVGVCV